MRGEKRHHPGIRPGQVPEQTAARLVPHPDAWPNQWPTRAPLPSEPENQRPRSADAEHRAEETRRAGGHPGQRREGADQRRGMQGRPMQPEGRHRAKAERARAEQDLRVDSGTSCGARETGESEMHDRARDWSERGRQPRGELPILRAAVPLARSSISITVGEKRKRTACSVPTPRQQYADLTTAKCEMVGRAKGNPHPRMKVLVIALPK